VSGQLIGTRVEFAISQLFLTEAHRNGFWRTDHLFFKKLMDAFIAWII
jgi:hypothetical protein